MVKNKAHLRTPSSKLMGRIVRNYLSNYKGLLGFAFLFMAFDALMTGAMAKLIEPMIDGVFGDKDETMLYPVAAAVFFVFMIRGLSIYAHTILMNRIGQKIVAGIQSDLFGHILSLDLNFFHQNTSGQLLSRMVNDVVLMRQAVAEAFTSMGKSVLTLVMLTIVMFYQDWQLALASFFVFPVAAIFVHRIGRRLRKVSVSTQEEMGHFSSLLTQSFQGIRQVKAYGMEAYESHQAESFINNLYKLVHKAVKVSHLTTPITETLTGLAMVTVIVYGGYQVIEGHNTTGSFFSFITAFMLAYEPMKKLAKLNGNLQMGLGAADRVFELLDRPPAITDRSGAKRLVLEKPVIEFRDVSFTYPDGTMALQGINLIAREGETVALVGASGSGKTTTLNLIPRFYEATSGAVLIDGQDVNDVTMESLRAHMALVSQEVSIFNDTVFSNIAYGRMGASKDDVIDAAKKAAAHDFIMALPSGYETVLGEQGLKLSGGQRQRIAIARAMLRNAPILLLDEATSALDTESERMVQTALGVLQQGKTTIVIAHRLSTIVNADKICVFNEGKIAEMGTHKELLAQKGIYANLYGLQESKTD